MFCVYNIHLKFIHIKMFLIIIIFTETITGLEMKYYNNIIAQLRMHFNADIKIIE